MLICSKSMLSLPHTAGFTVGGAGGCTLEDTTVDGHNPQDGCGMPAKGVWLGTSRAQRISGLEGSAGVLPEMGNARHSNFLFLRPAHCCDRGHGYSEHPK